MEIRPSGSVNSKILIAQDLPGYQELAKSEPLQGYSGMEFNRMLSEAGIMRSECFITSTIRRQVTNVDVNNVIAKAKKDVTPVHKPYFDKMVMPAFSDGAEMLKREIDLVKPNVVIALGNASLFALTGKWGVKSWRGSMIPYTSPKGHECVVIPTHPPDYINAVWKDRPIVVQDLRRARRVCDEGYFESAFNFLLSPSFSEVARTLQMLMDRVLSRPTKLSVDIETRGGHISCLGIGWSKLDAICIPFMVANLMSDGHYWMEEEEAFIAYKLYKLLIHPNCEVIGQNFIYDAQYLLRWFCFVPRFKRDTMLAQHSMFSNMQKGLDYLSSMYCENHLYWKDESKNWDPKIGEKQLWSYNCKDCVVTYEVDDVEQASISSMSANWPELPEVHAFQQSMFSPVLSSMVRGIRVDHTARERIQGELQAAILLREEYIRDVVGHELNIRSPKQMQDFFYRELAQKPVISRKTGNPTCDDSALETIGKREALLLPLLGKIAELRSLGVFLSTFIEAPVDIDGRMRCSFNIAGTETYRFSSSENAFGSGMNLQNIPKGDEDDEGNGLLPNVRRNFVPDPGMEFFDIDLDSADLRIVVWESDCKEMKSMFAEGLKPYVEIAKEYYRDPNITKNHPSYKLFKALCHGTNYLGTPSGLAGRIGLLTNEVERIQKWYYGKFPEIEDWQNGIKESVTRKRYVQNVFGYRTYYFDRIEGTIFNQAVAWIPQSTVGCLINRGYRNIHHNLPDVEVLLQVHDSLAGQFPIGTNRTSDIIRECSVPLPYAEPLVIPVGIKTSTNSWGDCG